MLRRIVLCVMWAPLSVFCLALVAQAAQSPKPTEQYSKYKKLVERAKNGDQNLDFVLLISAASDWDLSQKSVFEVPNREAMVEAFKKKDYKKAVELAELVLDYEFTNRG